MNQNFDPPRESALAPRLPYTILGGLFIERPQNPIPMPQGVVAPSAAPKPGRRSAGKRTGRWAALFHFPTALG